LPRSHDGFAARPDEDARPMMADREAAEAGLAEAQRCMDRGDEPSARAAAEHAARLLNGGDGDGLDDLRARSVLLRAAADEDGIPDAPRLAWAGDVLAGQALWKDAMSAYFMLARDAKDRGDAKSERRWLAFSLGSADAGGSMIYAPNILRRLALVELREGNAERAGELANLALERLKGVPSLNARLSEAECLETMGDAWADLGDREHAVTCWRDAMERQEFMERQPAVEALRAKIDGASR
jgi:tetratricopeptide (TPR) repeat protein